MRFRAMVSTVVLGALLIGGTAMPALAKDGDVIRIGACRGRSDWKLKLSEENGRIEVEYEGGAATAPPLSRVPAPSAAASSAASICPR